MFTFNMSPGAGINALHWIGAPHQSETKTENTTNKQNPEKEQRVGDTNHFGIIASEQPPQQNLFRKKPPHEERHPGSSDRPHHSHQQGEQYLVQSNLKPPDGAKRSEYPSYFFLRESICQDSIFTPEGMQGNEIFPYRSTTHIFKDQSF